MQNRTTKILTSLSLALLLTGSAAWAQNEGFTNTRSKKVQKEHYAGWYMRTRVQATAPDGKIYEHNTAGVFGELLQSKNGKDRHDIPSFAPAALQVVFPHYTWDEGDAGDYWSDYRKYSKRSSQRRRVWTFLIRNQKSVDLSDAEFRLFLGDAVKVYYTKEGKNVHYTERGTDPQMKERFTLVDVDEHRTYTPDELAYTTFSMDGNHTRTFRWVRGSVRKKDFRPVKMPE